MNGDTRRSVIIEPGFGPAYWVVGDHITVKLGQKQTDGGFSLVETTVSPGGGPPPHRHQSEDEMFYILQGQLSFVLDRHSLTGTEGDAVYLPRGIPHKFTNIGSTPARFLVFATPSGFEQFVAVVGRPCTDPSCPPAVAQEDIDKLLAATPAFGVEMLFTHQAESPGPELPDGRSYSLIGQRAKVKLTGKETAGRFCLCELMIDPGESVLPHRHLAADEIFYVLQGTFEFLLTEADGPHAVTAIPGSIIHVPRGTLHAVRNIGSQTGKLLDCHTPAGFEKFYEEAEARYRSTPEKIDAQALRELFERHGCSM